MGGGAGGGQKLLNLCVTTPAEQVGFVVVDCIFWAWGREARESSSSYFDLAEFIVEIEIIQLLA